MPIALCLPGACAAPYTWLHLQFFSVPNKRGLIPHKGVVGGSKSCSTIGLYQSVLKAGLLMGTLWKGGMCFSPAAVEKRSSIQGKLTAWCASTCNYMRRSVWGWEDVKQRSWTHHHFHSVNAGVFRSPSDLLKKEKNKILFAGLVNLRAVRLMVSEAFLPTPWDWIKTARLVWCHQVSDRILW